MSDGWANALPCPPLATPMASGPVKAVCLEKQLMAMNTTKTELRLYTLAIIIDVDTIHSSAERVYFDGVVN